MQDIPLRRKHVKGIQGTSGCSASIVLASTYSSAQTNVLTQHNDPQRTGTNRLETQLTVANVQSPDFGNLWDYRVLGRIYAQPLYVTLPRHSEFGRAVPPLHMIVVATAENIVTAFDADSSNATPLWIFNAGPSALAAPCL